MDNRISFKDLITYAGLFVIAVLLLLAMYMVDRQWTRLAQIESLIEEQASDIRGLRTKISSFKPQMMGGQSVSVLEGEEPDSAKPTRAETVAARDDYAEGDWLVTAFGNSLKTITPLISSDAYASEVQAYVLETLLQRNPETLEWEGNIAEAWTVSDDGLRFVFTLKGGVVFSDGVPLTAHDVAFTFAYMMDERIRAPRQRAYYDKIESVTALNDLQAEFIFKEPYFNSLSLAGGMEILAKHFYGPYLDDPESFNQSKGLLLGSGPYRLVDPRQWTPDQGMVELQRNPRYWASIQPSFDKIIWKIIENQTARLTSFRNGEVDVYSAKPREYQKLLKDDSLMSRSRSFEYLSPSAGYTYIGWNQQKGGEPTLFADKRVRQAMTYLTDKQRIIEEIMLGYGEAAVGPFSPQSPQHDPDLRPRKFDLDKARELLAEAGYKDRDGNSVLEGEDGKPFEFELVYFQDSEDTKRIVLFLKDLYAQAGIKLIPKPAEWSVMLDLLKQKNFDAITLGWTGSIEGDLFQIFHSTQTEPGADNFIGYANPELDQLIEQARGSVVEDERMSLWQAAEKILYEDQPYTFLMRRKSLVFIDQRMHNVEVFRTGLNISESPGGWYVPESLQKYH